jgi:hypothetical protein
MYLVINKCVTAVKVSNFSGHYICNCSTLDVGVLGDIGILYYKEHPPEVWHIPPGIPCMYKHTFHSGEVICDAALCNTRKPWLSVSAGYKISGSFITDSNSALGLFMGFWGYCRLFWKKRIDINMLGWNIRKCNTQYEFILWTLPL